MIRDNKPGYFFDEGLYYVQDGIKIDLGRSAENLDTFTPKEILLLNYKAENNEKAMTGEVTISGDGFNGFAEKALADFPKYLFGKNVDPRLRLAVGEDRKLGFSLSDPECAVSVGIENVAELTGSAPVTVTVLEDGTVTYHLPEKYSVNLLNELYKQDITAAPVDLAPGSSVKVSGIDLSYADISLSDTALEVSTEKKSGSISVKTLTYKSFAVNDLSGEVGEPGVSASAEQFSFSVGDTVLSGSLEGFEWKPGKHFSVSKFTLGADKIAFGDNISVENAGLHFSLYEGVFGLGAEGTFNIGQLQSGWIGISTERLKVSFTLTNEDNGFGLSAGTEGDIMFSIGKENFPVADVTVGGISYDKGVFGLETLTLNAGLDKLISDKFSGSADVTASGLTFSCKSREDLDLASIRLDISDLAYKGKTLVQSASVALIFKEDQQEEIADAGGELAVGESSGILTGGRIAVYLTEEKKGVRLTADSFSPSFDYLKMDITDFGASFFNNKEYDEVKGSLALSSGTKLNEILGIESLALTASDFSINSKGIRLGSVSASLTELAIANSITVKNLDVSLDLDDNSKFRSFKLGGSAELGKIGISGMSVAVGSDGTAELAADSISYNEKDLVISEVRGSFSNKGVNIASAKFSFKVINTDVSGLIENLSWSSESNFSVDKFAIEAGNIAVNEDFSIEDTQLEASLRDNSFKLGASATFHVGEVKKGIVEISADELKLALDLSEEKSEDGNSALKAAGSVEGNIGVKIGEIANAEIGDIGYEDGVFSVGAFSVETDLSRFGIAALGGSGNISVKDLKFQKGKAPTVGTMGLNIKGMSYNGKTLMDDVSVNIILNDEDKGSEGGAGEEKATADEAVLALADGDEGTLSGVDISVYLTDSFKGVKINANSFSITPGDFEFNFNSFKGEFSKNGCTMELKQATVKSDLTKSRIAELIGIENIQFSVRDASITDNKFKVGQISAEVASNIEVGGFRITGAKAVVNFNDAMGFEDIEIGGGLGYKDYISGSASIRINKEGEFSFGGAGNINISYGCFSGSLESIEKNDDIVTFNKLTLEKKTEGEPGFEGDRSNSFVAKFLRSVPDISVTLNKLTFINGELQKPSMDDVSINRFEKDFTLGKDKAVTAKIAYSGGDKGKFTIGAGGSFSVNKENIEIIGITIPIIPLISAKFSLGFSAILGANINFEASAERNDEKLDLGAKMDAGAKGKFGFYGAALISAGAFIASLECGVKIGLDLGFDGKLNGSFALIYDPQVRSLFDSFSIDKEATALSYIFTSDLNFVVEAMAGAKFGLPIISNQKKLTHSWNLLNYKLAAVNLSGAITYDKEKGKYQLDAKTSITDSPKFFYSPERTQHDIENFDKSISGLQKSLGDINAVLDEARGGIDPKKGSLGSIEGDLGGNVQTAKDAVMPMIKDVLDKSNENARKDHDNMEMLRRTIERSAQKMVENESNVERLERVVEDSRAALDIIGFKADDGEDGGMTIEKYRQFIADLNNIDDERIKRLAMLEPAAVLNMFKAFKLIGARSWAELHDLVTAGTSAQPVVAGQKPGRSSIRADVYDAGMYDIAKKIDEMQKSIDALEKRVSEAQKKLKEKESDKENIEKAFGEKIESFKTQRAEAEQRSEQRINKINETCRNKIAEINEAKAKARNKTNEQIAEAEREFARTLSKTQQVRDNTIFNVNENADSRIGGLNDGEQNTASEAQEGAGALSDMGSARERESEKIRQEAERIITQSSRAADRSQYRAAKKYSDAVSKANLRVKKIEETAVINIEKLRRAAQKEISEERSRAAANLNKINAAEANARQQYAKDIKLAEQSVAAANAEYEETKRKLDQFRQTMAQREDLSTAMAGFQGFVAAEHDVTKGSIDRLRQSYGIAGSTSTAGENAADPEAPIPQNLGDREALVRKMIDRLIDDAKNNDLEKNLGGAKGIAQHNERLAAIREGSGIVDKKMRGFGLSGNSVNDFNSKKARNEEFRTLQMQLDAVCKQLGIFHDVMMHALQIWNTVNGINFKNAKDTRDFTDGSLQVMNLIEDVNRIKDNHAVSDKLDTISQEVSRLGNGDVGSLQAGVTHADTDRMREENGRLGIMDH